MEKLLITGVNGLLGQKLLMQAASKYSIVGIDLHDQPFNKKIHFDYLKLDLTDRKAVKDAILSIYPHYLVNTAAMTNVDACENEKEKCWKINVEAVNNIVYAARKIGTKIVHLSTDYIFDGKKGPYDETATPSPLGYYGKSKLASENVLAASELDYAIVRTMVLYGDAEAIRPNFVTWLVATLKQGKSVTIVNDQFGNPTLADDLAAAIIRIIQLQKWDLYHVCGSELIDRYQFALKIADIYKLNKSLIHQTTTPELNQAALRPLKSGFIVDKAQNDLQIHLSNVEDGLRKMRKQSKKLIFFKS
ncbi:MAG: dTDP-4-dehydrorhamnose reductase [Candidatus Zhuqueibacterota bacterium]